jgi:hypothetical protein
MINRHRGALQGPETIFVGLGIELNGAIRIVSRAFEPSAVTEWKILARHKPNEPEDQKQLRARVLICFLLTNFYFSKRPVETASNGLDGCVLMPHGAAKSSVIQISGSIMGQKKGETVRLKRWALREGPQPNMIRSC